MEITTLKNGNLKMKATIKERKGIIAILRVCRGDIQAESKFVTQFLTDYRQVQPEDVGALTSATLIAQGEGKDMQVWGDMTYEVTSFLEELAIGNTVIWQKG